MKNWLRSEYQKVGTSNTPLGLCGLFQTTPFDAAYTLM